MSIDDIYERSYPGLNAAGRDAAAAAASNAKWAAAEDARDRAIAAEEEKFERETARCWECRRTAHPSSVCAKHRAKYGITE